MFHLPVAKCNIDSVFGYTYSGHVLAADHDRSILR